MLGLNVFVTHRESTHFLMAWSIKRQTGITVMAKTGVSTLSSVMASNQQVWLKLLELLCVIIYS